MASCRFRLKTVASLAPTYHPGSQPVPAVGSQHGRARTASPLGMGSDPAKRSFSFSTPPAALDSTLHMFLLRASLNPSASPSPPEPHLSSPEARPARVPPRPSGSVQTGWQPLSGSLLAPPQSRSGAPLLQVLGAAGTLVEGLQQEGRGAEPGNCSS